MSSELSEQERANLARLVMGILSTWNVSDEEKLKLLGMEDEKPRELSRLRKGNPLPDSDMILNRAKHILGIEESLHVVFPLNPNMPAYWLNHHQRPLKGIPLTIMLEEGIGGMFRVWQNLDCTVGWD